MKAMILAAGRGTRMGAITDQVPKPLLSAAGKPLIVRHLEKLAAAGLRDVIVNLAHLGEQIEEALGTGDRYGVSIQYSREATALETAGGVAWALPLLGAAPFALINADMFIDFDYAELPRRQLSESTRAHLVMVANPPHHVHGDFGLEQGQVRNAAAPLLTYCGLGIYRPQLFHGVTRGEKVPLAPLLRQAIAERQVRGERHAGYWIDAGTPQRLTQLDDYLKARAL